MYVFVRHIDWLMGIRPVCFFHFGGISYAAGFDPTHRIYSHNTGIIKP